MPIQDNNGTPNKFKDNAGSIQGARRKTRVRGKVKTSAGDPNSSNAVGDRKKDVNQKNQLEWKKSTKKKGNTV